MTIVLRDYQQKAVDATITALSTYKTVLAVLATGSGKSLINAEIALRATKKGLKVLCLCHQAEILEQNEKAILMINSSASVGVYCAGLGRKELRSSIIIASRDSFRNCNDIDFDLIIVDEAHRLSAKKESGYQKIIAKIKPKYVIGMTATPWRGTELLTDSNNFFEKIVVNVGIKELTQKGYLSPTVFSNNKQKLLIKAEGLKKTGDDFNLKALGEITDTWQVVTEALDDWQTQASDRKLSLFFCVSIVHAKNVYKALQERGIATGYLDGKTHKEERAKFFKDALEGKFKAIVNVGTMTTGVNIPQIDCVVILRATQSPSLFVQIVGRGLRIHEDKKDCLVLDYTDNFERFESIEKPMFLITKKSIEKKKIAAEVGEVNLKQCPKCLESITAQSKVCSFCGHFFINHTSKAYYGKNFIIVTSKILVETMTRSGEPCFILTLNGVYKKWLLHTRQDFIGKQARDFLETYKAITYFTEEKKENFQHIKFIGKVYYD